MILKMYLRMAPLFLCLDLIRFVFFSLALVVALSVYVCVFDVFFVSLSVWSLSLVIISVYICMGSHVAVSTHCYPCSLFAL